MSNTPQHTPTHQPRTVMTQARKPSKPAPAKTLPELHARCTECGDCLLWQGAHNGTGHPRHAGGSVRRAVWALTHRPAPANRIVTVTCGQIACLNPAHLALTTRGEVTRIVHNRPDVRMRRAAASARTNQATMGKISMAIARQIRASTQTGVDLARHYGVSTSLVSLVRQGKTWVERTASPWRGLGA